MWNPWSVLYSNTRNETGAGGSPVSEIFPFVLAPPATRPHILNSFHGYLGGGTKGGWPSTRQSNTRMGIHARTPPLPHTHTYTHTHTERERERGRERGRGRGDKREREMLDFERERESDRERERGKSRQRRGGEKDVESRCNYRIL